MEAGAYWPRKEIGDFAWSAQTVPAVAVRLTERLGVSGQKLSASDLMFIEIEPTLLAGSQFDEP